MGTSWENYLMNRRAFPRRGRGWPTVEGDESRLMSEVRTMTETAAKNETSSRFHPSEVLLKIGLPGLNGFEVARRLRADTAFESSNLIAITGYGDEETRRLSSEAGFDVHLCKPVPPKVLL